MTAAPRRGIVQKVFRMTMGSNPRNIHRVERFLVRVNRAVKISEERFGTLLVVVTEAVNNAIIHGNKRDPRKQVLVTCTFQKGILVVKVKDEGEGFDPDRLPSPIHEDNLLRESGRGVFLMKQLMESVRYNKKGNEVTMRMTIA